MLRRTILMLAALALLLVVAPGYVKAQPAAPAAKSYTPAEKQAYQQKVASNLNEMQEKIDELKVKARQVVQQKKRMAMRMMVNLQRQANVAKNTLAVLEKAPEKDWSTLKVKMDKAMEDLAQAYNGAKAHLE